MLDTAELPRCMERECAHAGIISASPAGIKYRCREHHYKLRGYTGMEGKTGNELPEPLSSMSVKWMHKRIERLKVERANVEANLLAKG